MESYTIIVLIFGFLILFLLVTLFFVNHVLHQKNTLDNRFLAIRENLDRQVNIVDGMIEFLETNFEHEKSYQKKLKQARELLLTINNNKEGIQTLKKINVDIQNFINLENTYKNLNKNKKYLQIKKDIQANKDKLDYAFDVYDKGVIDYNNYRKKKHIYLLSKLCRIPEYDCYNK